MGISTSRTAARLPASRDHFRFAFGFLPPTAANERSRKSPFRQRAPYRKLYLRLRSPARGGALWKIPTATNAPLPR